VLAHAIMLEQHVDHRIIQQIVELRLLPRLAHLGLLLVRSLRALSSRAAAARGQKYGDSVAYSDCATGRAETERAGDESCPRPSTGSSELIAESHAGVVDAGIGARQVGVRDMLIVERGADMLVEAIAQLGREVEIGGRAHDLAIRMEAAARSVVEGGAELERA